MKLPPPNLLWNSYVFKLIEVSRISEIGQNSIANLCKKLSAATQQRLLQAKQIMRKKKENSHQSPNFILVKIFYRAQNLFEKLVVSDKIVSNELLTEMMAENSIQVHEIYQLVRRRLSLQERESIQLFCNKKLITNPTVTVGQLRMNLTEGFLKIDVTKMEIF